MNDNINNNGFYKDTDTNFETAYNLCEKNFTHIELINMLKNGNIPEKQIAALKFDCICDTKDAQILLNNLTGCDGKIREAIAHKINSFIVSDPNTRELFASISAEIFADATIDINANICRLIVDSAEVLKEYQEFATKYTNKILSFTQEALEELDKFIFRDKKYVINKQLFKLYWCLEALSIFYDSINKTTLDKILNKCAKQKEYTIREKVAAIIAKTNEYQNIKKELLHDENYYVREILHHPSFF